MVRPREAGLERFTIYGLGAWSRGRPVSWARSSAGIAAGGYAVVALYHQLGGLVPWPELLFEYGVALVAAGAFLVARSRPVLASAVLLVAVGLEAFASLAATPDLGASALLVILLLILGSGVLLGHRAAAAAAASVVLLVPLTLAIGGRFGPSLERLSPQEVSRLIIFELCAIAVGVLTWHTLRTFARILAAAEERRQLEVRLLHLQRLELLGMVAGGVAHDFKNVLGVLVGAAGELERVGDPLVREIAAGLRDTANSGMAAVRQLLDLARREEPSHGVVDVAAEARGRLQRSAVRLLGHRCRLELEVAGPAHAVIDTVQLEQVVLNLVANARDAVGEGGLVRLAVRPLARDAAAAAGSRVVAPEQVLIEVGDDGPGVPEELRDRIFEPFLTTKPRGQGSGFGLATVRAIAEGVGGCAVCSAREGGGAAFRVFLPRAGAAEQPADQAT
jgi:signal transduction histidine kinase